MMMAASAVLVTIRAAAEGTAAVARDELFSLHEGQTGAAPFVAVNRDRVTLPDPALIA